MEKNNKQGNFPDPLASTEAKTAKSYGLKYARAIESQWGHTDDHGSIFRRRLDEFERYRDYANGTQDTKIYKQILNSLDPNNGDGTLLNIDWSPVPIIPKFVKIVVNKILSKNPYPNVEAIDPLSITEKERKKAEVKFNVDNKDMLQQAQMAGLDIGTNLEQIPDTPEEAEIFLASNVKTNAEIAAQIAANLTLEWNEYNHTIHRRAVTDLVSVGMGVTKTDYDPNYGLVAKYVDPAYFIHSYTEDPLMNDLTYAGHVKRLTISELRRLAGDEFTEEEYTQMARNVQNKYANDPNKLSHSYYDRNLQRTIFGYDEYIVEVMDFEFLSVDDVFYESKESRFGNVGFYYKGMVYQPPKESVFDRKPTRMSFVTLYGGSFIVGTDKLYGYGMKHNQPRNIHDITRTRLSYSAVAVNMRRMIPKSMVSGIVGFADQLQITHLKIQQSVAKAKPDGLIIDIEGLENVQLGQGGDLQPLEIQDIYEQTGIFYYRSKNPEGGFQNPPIREIGNAIRNIEAYVGIYNHYLRMIRDATGINEVVDASTPKGDALVGVRQQAIEASNNATYDITHASMMLYKKVVEYIVKCMQIMPPQSVIYRVYENAIGKSNMDVLASFRDLPMYNFGVSVVPEMSDSDKMYLEANIQQSLAQGEIDLEDALSIRRLKDVDQAEQLLVVRRKKRIKQKQDIAAQNSQMQSQMNQQSVQASAQAAAQTEEVKSQLEMQRLNLESQIKMQLLEREYQLKIELAKAEGESRMAVNQEERDFRMNVEGQREQAKDSRVKKQAVEQSKLISQRKGERGELTDEQQDLMSQILGNQ